MKTELTEYQQLESQAESSHVMDRIVSYNPRYRDNVILRLTFDFSLSVWDFAEHLNKLRKFNVENQVFRSGTSIGANVKEAQNAESKADFIHKLKIALKEADETEYWLMICLKKGIENSQDLLDELVPIIRILNKIISSSKK